MSGPALSSHFLRHFMMTVAGELGQENLATVLNKAGLSPDRADPANWGSLTGLAAAETYAEVQKAMRTYYGRGARGILIRMGGILWKRLLKDAPMGIKAQSKLVFGLPVKTRRKPALDLFANLLAGQYGDMTVHTLDLNMLMVDRTSPGTLGQNEPEKICYVTLGLLRECLFWATGQEHDIEETSCCANGEQVCEFKITLGR